MLTSCKLTGDPKATANYHMGEENYYFSQAGSAEGLAGDGAPGTQDHVRVHGELLRELGFRDGQAITREQFTNMLSGKDAWGVKVSGWRKVHGIDLTFSAPKSVSVAALLTHRDPKILEAHEDAVLEVMREIEYQCGAAQPKPGVCAPTHKLAYVTALDGFNREHEPHIHTHVVIANMTFYNGKVYALDGREIMTRAFNKMWGAMYRGKLATKLKALGYGVTYTKKGEIRLDAVSLEVEKAFSGRRAQILEAKGRGLRDMAAWDTTRKGKDPEVGKEEVLAKWQKKLEQFQEKSPEVNRAEALSERTRWCQEAHWSVEARQELGGERVTGEVGRWQLAVERATQSSACVTKDEIITEYLTELARTESWKNVTYAQAEAGLEAQVKAGHILRTDNGFYTSWEMARADRECVQRHEAWSVALTDWRARRDVAAYQEAARSAGRKLLSERQIQVAVGILTAGEGTVIVQGDAGSGKTTMLRAVNHVASAARFAVYGVAVQGVAARNLENESGIESCTLASYLEDAKQRTDSGGPRLVVLDEASMLGSRDAAKLLTVAARRGDKVVLVGDRNQIQSIGAGRPFERLIETAEASGKLLSLQDNWRQRNPVLREAVDLARQGQMRQSFDLLESKGHVIEVHDALQRRTYIAGMYKKDTLILTGTVESCEDLNKKIRAKLMEKGELDPKTQREYRLSRKDNDGVRHDSYRQIAAGERIRFLENDYRDNLDVRNGECGTVEKTLAGALEVRHDDGRLLKIDLSQYSMMDHGYAVTTYKGQGQTFDRVLVEADTRIPQLQDQRNSYVQITRARDEIAIFTDDAEALRDIAGILNGKRDTLDLKADLEESKRMEAKVDDLARREVASISREAEAFGQEAAESITAPIEIEEPAPIRIENETALFNVGGIKDAEKDLRAQMQKIEDHINGRDDLAHADKLRLAAVFNSGDASTLLLIHSLPEHKILGAEVALGIKSEDEACAGLKSGGKWAVKNSASMARGIARSRRVEPTKERDHVEDFGFEL